MHQVGLDGIAIIVTGEMKDPMRRQQLELERQRDAYALRLPDRSVGRNHHLTQQATGRVRQLQRERKHIGAPADPAMGSVQRTNRPVIDDGHVDVAVRAAQRVERALRGTREAPDGEYHAALPIDDRGRHQAGPGGGGLRRASCASYARMIAETS